MNTSAHAAILKNLQDLPEPHSAASLLMGRASAVASANRTVKMSSTSKTAVGPSQPSRSSTRRAKLPAATLRETLDFLTALLSVEDVTSLPDCQIKVRVHSPSGSTFKPPKLGTFTTEMALPKLLVMLQKHLDEYCSEDPRKYGEGLLVKSIELPVFDNPYFSSFPKVIGVISGQTNGGTTAEYLYWSNEMVGYWEQFRSVIQIYLSESKEAQDSGLSLSVRTVRVDADWDGPEGIETIAGGHAFEDPEHVEGLDSPVVEEEDEVIQFDVPQITIQPANDDQEVGVNGSFKAMVQVLNGHGFSTDITKEEFEYGVKVAKAPLETQSPHMLAQLQNLNAGIQQGKIHIVQGSQPINPEEQTWAYYQRMGGDSTFYDVVSFANAQFVPKPREEEIEAQELGEPDNSMHMITFEEIDNYPLYKELYPVSDEMMKYREELERAVGFESDDDEEFFCPRKPPKTIEFSNHFDYSQKRRSHKETQADLEMIVGSAIARRASGTHSAYLESLSRDRSFASSNVFQGSSPPTTTVNYTPTPSGPGAPFFQTTYDEQSSRHAGAVEWTPEMAASGLGLSTPSDELRVQSRSPFTFAAMGNQRPNSQASGPNQTRFPKYFKNSGQESMPSVDETPEHANYGADMEGQYQDHSFHGHQMCGPQFGTPTTNAYIMAGQGNNQSLTFQMNSNKHFNHSNLDSLTPRSQGTSPLDDMRGIAANQTYMNPEMPNYTQKSQRAYNFSASYNDNMTMQAANFNPNSFNSQLDMNSHLSNAFNNNTHVTPSGNRGSGAGRGGRGALPIVDPMTGTRVPQPAQARSRAHRSANSRSMSRSAHPNPTYVVVNTTSALRAETPAFSPTPFNRHFSDTFLAGSGSQAGGSQVADQSGESQQGLVTFKLIPIFYDL